MKILADTHIVLWTLLNHDKLPKEARALLSDTDNQIFFSAVSIWEIAMKHAAHPEALPFTGGMFYDLCLQSGMRLSEPHVSHFLAFETLHRAESAPPHKDPFDKLLIAQAKSEGMLFLTHDSLLADYQEPCVMVV